MTPYERFWFKVYIVGTLVTTVTILRGHSVWESVTGVGLALVGAMHIYWRVFMEPAEEKRIEAMAMARAWDLYRAHIKEEEDAGA